MVSSYQVFAAAALLSLGSAAPSSKPSLSFSLREVANPNYVPEDHATLYRRALEKANPGLERRSKEGDATTNAAFQVPVKIGDQTFSLTFDTGSADLWVLGDGLSGKGKHTYYKPGSTAKKADGTTFKIGYADGSSASGDVYADNVSVGDVSLTGMKVGHATNATSAFTDSDVDGLLGLGPGKTSASPNTPTFMDTFAAQGGQKFFAVDLHKDAPGTYDFGMTDKSKYSGDIAYTSADTGSGYWLITTDDKIKAIVDTGTTVTVMPKDVASKYWSQVKSAKSYVPDGHGTETIWDFDCSETLPDYSLQVGGKTVKVPGTVINMGNSGTAGRCTGGLQVNTDFKSWNIIGAMFIKGMYVVYDFGTTGKPRIGFAAKSTAATAYGGTGGNGTDSGSTPPTATVTPIPVTSVPTTMVSSVAPATSTAVLHRPIPILPSYERLD